MNQVTKNRNLPVEEVAKLADGSSMPSRLALEAKLIDALGDKETIRQWFAEKLNITLKEVYFANKYPCCHQIKVILRSV